jgi:hypothetical protein
MVALKNNRKNTTKNSRYTSDVDLSESVENGIHYLHNDSSKWTYLSRSDYTDPTNRNIYNEENWLEYEETKKEILREVTKAECRLKTAKRCMESKKETIRAFKKYYGLEGKQYANDMIKQKLSNHEVYCGGLSNYEVQQYSTDVFETCATHQVWDPGAFSAWPSEYYASDTGRCAKTGKGTDSGIYGVAGQEESTNEITNMVAGRTAETQQGQFHGVAEQTAGSHDRHPKPREPLPPP